MANGKLVLQAPSNFTPLNRSALIDRLVEFGLVGAGYGETSGAYLVGPRFLQLITFLGCSPHVQLEPPADGSDDFCHLVVRGPFQAARLFCAANTRPPRCPACGTSLTQWRQLEQSWVKGRSELKVHCLSCGHSASPAELEWRRKAGFGHYFIEIHGIFPEEAVPLPALLDFLRGNGDPWRYFYLQEY